MSEKDEEKFIVINKKYIDPEKIPLDLYFKFHMVLKELSKFIPENKYYVCNQVEPYAQKVLDIILEGEKEKQGE